MRQTSGMDYMHLTGKSQRCMAQPKGFDDYELKLGDIMRGERATLGKSLLDVQRELRIKASYISAIENCDSEAFDTPGFISGYVRSYAKYLGMCPEIVYEKFCEESGHFLVHGMCAEPSRQTIGLSASKYQVKVGYEKNLFVDSASAFLPTKEGILEKIEVRALVSMTVLAALLFGFFYGGWYVLKEVQRVQIAPADIMPVVMSEIDSLTDKTLKKSFTNDEIHVTNGMARIYRPKAIDVPILNTREASIALLDPSNYGNFRPEKASLPPIKEPVAAEVIKGFNDVGFEKNLPKPAIQMSEKSFPDIALFAVRDAWVSVKTSNGDRIFEKVLKAGHEFVLPASEMPPTLRAGMSGSIYFSVSGELYGPAGIGADIVKNVVLSQSSIKELYKLADLKGDPELLNVASAAKVSTFTITAVSD